MIAPYSYQPSERYDIFLATPFEDCEFNCWRLDKNKKFSFYDAIEISLRETGKRVFLAHREFLHLERPAFTAEIGISRSNLVLVDIGVPSNAAGIMLQTAFDNHISVISFQNTQDPYKNNDRMLEGALEYHSCKRIIFDGEEYGLGKIIAAVKEFYAQ